MKEKVNIFWFRRDLRLTDNVGLHYALSNNLPVVAIFIFDPNILDQLENRYDRRVDYFHQALTEMNKILIAQGSNLFTYYGGPQEIFQYLMQQYDIQQVFCNRDYEPSAISRDNQIENMLLSHSITFKSFKDQVIFEGADILKSDGTPYTVNIVSRSSCIRLLMITIASEIFQASNIPPRLASLCALVR